MPLLELNDAAASYNGKVVLRGVSLRIERGECVALVGSSGSGKTTLLNMLYAQQHAEAALVPQDLGLVVTLSVFHNVFIGRLNRNPTWYNVANLVRPFGKELVAVEEVLESLGMAAKILTPVAELSGGQQQRTAVSRALYQDASIFLGDEPVSAVDEHQSRTVLDNIVGKYQTAVLAMHDVPLAIEYVDRLIGMRQGEIVLDELAAGMTSTDLDALYKS